MPIDHLPTIQYQGVAEPVLPANLTPETVMESKWHQPWSDPVGTIWKATNDRLRIVLAASGSFEGQYDSRLEPGKYAPWFMPLSEPVRVPRRVASFPDEWWDPLKPPVPTILLSEWFANLSEPVRLPVGTKAPYQQYEFFDVGESVPLAVIRMTWYNWLSEPVRIPPRLLEALQQEPAMYVRFIPVNPPVGVNLPLYTAPQSVNSQGGYYPANYWAGRLNPNG